MGWAGVHGAPAESLLLVAGAGSAAREAAAVLDALGLLPRVRAFVQQAPPPRGQAILGIPVRMDACLSETPRARLVAGVGSPLRKRWYTALEAQGHAFVTVAHPKAALHPAAQLGPGCTVHAGVAVGADAQVGRHVLLNWNCTVAHDARLGDYAHVSLGAVVGGGAAVGAGSVVGMGAVVTNGVEVGPGTLVGAGSVVTRDLPGGVIALGSPAKVHRMLDPGEWDRLVKGGSGRGEPLARAG